MSENTTPSIYDDRYAKALAQAKAEAVVTATTDTTVAILNEVVRDLNSGLKGFDPNIPGLVEVAGGQLGNLSTTLRKVADQVIQLHYELSKLYYR